MTAENPSVPNEGDLETLIQRVCDETLDESGWHLLRARLAADPMARVRYLKVLDVHAALLEGGIPVAVSRPQRSWSVPRLTIFAALAACLLAAVGLGLWSVPTGTVDARVAEVVTVSGPVEISTGDGPPKSAVVGSVCRIGDRLTTDAGGSLSVRLTDNSRLDLGGEARLEVLASTDGPRYRLTSGTLRADVRPQVPDRALRVITPHAEIEVVGTEFRVATDAARTAVATDHGLVRVSGVSGGPTIDVPAGSEIVAGAGRGPLAVVPSLRLSPVRWSVPVERTRHLSITPEGQIVGLFESALKTFHPASGRIASGPVEVVDAKTFSHDLSADGTLLALNSRETVVGYDTRAGAKIVTMELDKVVGKAVAWKIALSGNGRRIVTYRTISGPPEEIRVSDFVPGASPAILPMPQKVALLTVSRSGRRIGYAVPTERTAPEGSHRYVILDLAAPHTPLLDVIRPQLHLFAFAPSEDAVAIVEPSGVTVMPLAGKPLTFVPPPTGWVARTTAIAFSPDGRYLAVGTSDGRVVLWDGTFGREIARLTAGTSVVVALAVGRDGRAVVAGLDRTIAYWDALSP